MLQLVLRRSRRPNVWKHAGNHIQKTWLKKYNKALLVGRRTLLRKDPALWQSCVVSSGADWACLTSCVFEEACGKRRLWICFLEERFSVSKRMLHSFCGDCPPFKRTISKGWDCGSPNFPIWGFVSAALIILEKVFIRHSFCTGRISLAARSRKGSRYKILWFQCPSSSQEDLMKSPRFTIWNSYCTDRYG